MALGFTFLFVYNNNKKKSLPLPPKQIVQSKSLAGNSLRNKTLTFSEMIPDKGRFTANPSSDEGLSNNFYKSKKPNLYLKYVR